MPRKGLAIRQQDLTPDKGNGDFSHLHILCCHRTAPARWSPFTACLRNQSSTRRCPAARSVEDIFGSPLEMNPRASPSEIAASWIHMYAVSSPDIPPSPFAHIKPSIS